MNKIMDFPKIDLSKIIVYNDNKNTAKINDIKEINIAVFLPKYDGIENILFFISDS